MEFLVPLIPVGKAVLGLILGFCGFLGIYAVLGGGSVAGLKWWEVLLVVLIFLVSVGGLLTGIGLLLSLSS